MENLTRNKEGNLVINDEDSIIETYEIDKAVTFQKFMNHLISLDFSRNAKNVCLEDLSDEEKMLVDVLNRIIDDYNQKREEYRKFEEDHAVAN